MSKFLAISKDLLQDDKGVSSIEYALLGMLIAVAIIGSVFKISGAVKEMYELIATSMP
ncbi:Flp family type IVb pilin [Cupriavidus oxalaticus]|uniref:Flp family type IVb pilin n=1 Tax=Cupriavidus oxalaticus TaxID=96344 RepID=A0A4P7LDV1_9BURK|nr:Flp family type IVb pilin [Cupriavidus oxalaticus]QBY52349.1 Flp family type IVb pilin [Cupriavidus oxalaticus]